MIVWLASYPRSGNTLLRTVLRHAFGQRSYSIHNDKFGDDTDAVVADLVGHLPIDVPIDDFLKQSCAGNRLTLIKTHDAPLAAYDSETVIYVVRDGRSVVVSYLNYLRRVMRRPNVTLDHVIRGQNVKFGDWSSHIVNWHPTVRSRALIVRYEVLAYDTAKAIRAISDFLELSPIADWRNDFSRMHQIYPQFFNAGDDRKNIAALRGNSEKLFWELHGDSMTQMGYG